jgi:hypothetical protein
MPLPADEHPVVHRRRRLVRPRSEPGRARSLRQSFLLHLIKIVNCRTHHATTPTPRVQSSIPSRRNCELVAALMCRSCISLVTLWSHNGRCCENTTKDRAQVKFAPHSRRVCCFTCQTAVAAAVATDLPDVPRQSWPRIKGRPSQWRDRGGAAWPNGLLANQSVRAARVSASCSARPARRRSCTGGTPRRKCGSVRAFPRACRIPLRRAGRR